MIEPFDTQQSRTLVGSHPEPYRYKVRVRRREGDGLAIPNLSLTQVAAIEAWCIETLDVPTWDRKWMPSPPPHHETHYSLYFVFARYEDAVHFLLRWSSEIR